MVKMMSKYFSEKEMFCHCWRCKGKRPSLAVYNNLKRTAAALDIYREKLGKPIYIDDAYRCPAHNKECGGVSGSAHMLGLAADCRIAGMNEAQMFEFFAEMPTSNIPHKPKSKTFMGAGYYPGKGFCHVDIERCKPRPNTWRG